jgi:hypothetical protein
MFLSSEARGYFFMSSIGCHENPQFVSSEVQQLRLLTEVAHLRRHMDRSGNIPDEVLAAVVQNLETAVCELGIPSAVTETVHHFETVTSPEGRRERAAMWLGRNVVQAYVEGAAFYQYESGKARGRIEVAEAEHGNKYTRPGVAQVFISPKMTAKDGTAEQAKADHVYDDDSVRVSFPIVDKKDQVVGRRLSSLLVRDIPLAAWVAMLKDEHNMFGRSFPVSDEESALSIMELFPQLELPIEKLPEGATSLVDAVIPYIVDEFACQKVKRQLKEFRQRQHEYKGIAQACAAQWLEFEIELARSFEHEQSEATFPIRQMIVSLQDEWSADERAIIDAHAKGDTHYVMSEELAVVLENAKRHLLGAQAAVAARNERALADVSPERRAQIVIQQNRLDAAERAGASQAALMKQQQQLNRLLARSNIKVGGGCAGNTHFGSADPDSSPGSSILGGGADVKNSGDKKDWKWKKGNCQVKTCPSPKPTEVGPCSVCRRCQAEFDAGRDPAKTSFTSAETTKPIHREGNVTYAIFGEKEKRQSSKRGGVLIALAAAA